MTPDAAVSRLAGRPGGALSRAQARACGFHRPHDRLPVASGRWRRVHRGVYAVAGLPPSWTSTVWAAVLAAGDGAVASHETALLLHGLSDRLVPRRPVTVTTHHGVHVRVAGAVVDQSRDLAALPVVRHASGLVVTTPARPICSGRVLEEQTTIIVAHSSRMRGR